MSPDSRRDELIERLRYTFISATYDEIDVLLSGLEVKENLGELCEEFFEGCRIDSHGHLMASGFFKDAGGSASLNYALYELLARAPDTFLIKHRVTSILFRRGDMTGTFRLPKGVFSLPGLRVFTVQGVGISRLPPEMAGAKNLRAVDLRGNRFRKFPTVLTKLPKLVLVNLAYNRIESLPDSLGWMRRVKILNLCGNRLRTLPAGMQRLQALRSLDLTMNRLTGLPKSLDTLLSLSDLRVAYNDMTAAEEAVWEVRFPLSGYGNQGSLDL